MKAKYQITIEMEMEIDTEIPPLQSLIEDRPLVKDRQPTIENITECVREELRLLDYDVNKIQVSKKAFPK